MFSREIEMSGAAISNEINREIAVQSWGRLFVALTRCLNSLLGNKIWNWVAWKHFYCLKTGEINITRIPRNKSENRFLTTLWMGNLFTTWKSSRRLLPPIINISNHPSVAIRLPLIYLNDDLFIDATSLEKDFNLSITFLLRRKWNFVSRSRDCVVFRNESKAESGILLSFVKRKSSVAEIKIVYGNRVILPTTGNSSFNCWFLFVAESRQFRRLRQKPAWNGEKFVILWSSFFVFLPFHSDNDWIERQSVKIFRYCLPFLSRALRSYVVSTSADIRM